LARNHLPAAARAAIALRLLRGEQQIDTLSVAQLARLCRVSRGRIDKQLGRHRNVGDAIVRSFQRLSEADRTAFVRSVGIEQIWAALQAAL
jgi:hypothetical protein